MSVDLHVGLVRPMSIGDLVDLVPGTVRELLNVAALPSIEIQELNSGVQINADLAKPLDEQRSWIVRLTGFEGQTILGAASVEDWSHPDGQRTFVWVNAPTVSTPLNFALVGAVTLALARIQRQPIMDHAEFFTSDNETNVETLVDRVRVRTSPAGIADAANAFYSGLHRSGA